MLINLSNHPFSLWTEVQKQEARNVYGSVTDLPFPSVSPDWDEDIISALADEYCRKVFELAVGRVVSVHIMGEMTLTLALVHRLQTEGISCVASTSERVVRETSEGHKESLFQFVRFREYEKI